MNVIEIDAASNNGVDNIREIREEVATALQKETIRYTLLTRFTCFRQEHSMLF